MRLSLCVCLNITGIVGGFEFTCIWKPITVNINRIPLTHSELVTAYPNLLIRVFGGCWLDNARQNYWSNELSQEPVTDRKQAGANVAGSVGMEIGPCRASCASSSLAPCSLWFSPPSVHLKNYLQLVSKYSELALWEQGACVFWILQYHQEPEDLWTYLAYA